MSRGRPHPPPLFLPRGCNSRLWHLLCRTENEFRKSKVMLSECAFLSSLGYLRRERETKKSKNPTLSGGWWQFLKINCTQLLSFKVAVIHSAYWLIEQQKFINCLDFAILHAVRKHCITSQFQPRWFNWSIIKLHSNSVFPFFVAHNAQAVRKRDKNGQIDVIIISAHSEMRHQFISIDL